MRYAVPLVLLLAVAASVLAAALLALVAREWWRERAVPGAR